MAIKLLAFTDFETDGLEYLTLSPLEVAVLVALPNRNGTIEESDILWMYDTLIQPVDPDWQENCDPFLSTEMHVKNGLIADFDLAKIESRELPTLTDVDVLIEEALNTIVESRFPGEDVAIHMAGTGVAAFDRPLVTLRMPAFSRSLHHRPVDMSVTNETLRSMGKDVDVPTNPLNREVAHRAKDDVLQSLEAFNWFSNHITLR